MREADVAIRMHPPRQPDLVQRHLGEIRNQIWASPEYAKAHGLPETVEELDNHKIILFGDRKPPVPDVNWLGEIGRKDGTVRRGVLEVNSLQAMLACIRAGIGIGSVPDYLVQDQTGLVSVLPEVKKPVIEMYFVYPEELRNSKRVSVFRDFLVNSIAERNGVRP
jgi:DNA-binding transcriptional LysR family regulator